MEKNISFSNFNKFPNLLIALSLREDKNMKVYYEFGKDDREKLSIDILEIWYNIF